MRPPFVVGCNKTMELGQVFELCGPSSERVEESSESLTQLSGWTRRRKEKVLHSRGVYVVHRYTYLLWPAWTVENSSTVLYSVCFRSEVQADNFAMREEETPIAWTMVLN